MNQTHGVISKEHVRRFWDANPCNNEYGEIAGGARAYYDEIEEFRYRNEPEIFEFAQFTRFNGKKILECGVGMGTDFTQWVRAGAEAHGIDLTEAGIGHTTSRLEAYGLRPASLLQGDVENIPHPDNSFDLVYSWGVIHHSPHTAKALSELYRVCKPGGMVKFMIYNKWSAVAVMYWLMYALRDMKPWQSMNDVFGRHVESPGTKVYSLAETRRMVEAHSVFDLRLRCFRPYFSHLSRYPRWMRPFIRAAGATICALLGGEERAGYFLTVQFRKAA